MKIFWGSGSGPAWRVLLAAELKKLPYESELLSFSAREHKAPEILAMNPRGKVPVLVDGDFALYESLAILAYLDEKYPDPPLFGTSPEEKGQTWCRVMELESYLSPAIRTVTRPLLFGQLAEKKEEVTAGIAPLHEELARLEGWLGDSAWLAGARVSAADVVALPLVMTALRAAGKPGADTLDLGLLPLGARYPKLDAWKARMEAIPGYERTYPPHWRDG
jgi:glutathione S-transferase